MTASADAAHLNLRRQLVLALFWFGISFLWGGLLTVAMPFLLVPEHPGPGNLQLVAAGDKNTALSVLETAGLVIALLVQPAAGAFSDRLRTRWGRRRPLIAIGVAGGIASLVLVATAQVFLMLLLGYCVLQLFMNIAQGAYQGLLPDSVPGGQRGTASGLLGLGILVGTVAGVAVAGPLSPRLTCAVIGVVLLATGIATVFGVHEPPLEPAPAVTRQRERPLPALRDYFAELRRYPDFCWVVLSRFLIFTALAAIQRFAAFYISDTFRGRYELFGVQLGSAKVATSTMLAVVIVFGIAVTYPAVRVSDRIGRRRVLMSAALLGALACALFAVAGSVTQVVVFALPAALCFGMTTSVDWAFMTDLAPRRRAGKFLGFSNIATAGAQAAAPTLLGPVIDLVNAHTASSGAPGTGGYRVLFVVAAASFLLGAAVLLRVRRPRLQEADEPVSVAPTLALSS